jgi:hypothetical protein
MTSAIVRAEPVDRQLVTLSEIHKQLTSMTDISDVKEARDRAEAIRTYCQRARKGLAAQNEAAYVKILAERRAGELLSQVERKQGSRNGEGLRAIAAQSGIPETTAKRWQTLSKLPASRLTAIVNDVADSLTTDNPEELTTSMVLVAATGFLRESNPSRPTIIELDDVEVEEPAREIETAELSFETASSSEPDDPHAHRVAVMLNVARLLQNAIDISDEIEELSFVARNLRQLYPKIERKINEYA